MSNNTRIKNSIRNMFWATVNNVASILFPFFIRTVMIYELGEETTGLVTLYKSIIEVMCIADLGIKTAINASLYKPIADNDKDKIGKILKLYKRMYLAIATALFIVGLCIMPFINYLIEGEIPEAVNIYILWLIYVILASSGYLFAYNISFLDANQRVDIGYKIFLFIRVFEFSFQYISVIVFRNVYLYVIARVLSTLIYGIICKFECIRRFPGCEPKGELARAEKDKITRELSALAIQKIGNTVSVSLDAVVISAYLGLTTVAIYGNYNYIIQAVSSFIIVLGTSIVSSIGNSICNSSVDTNYKTFRRLFFINSWIVGWSCICFVVIFQDFMTMWMGEKLLFEEYIVVFLVLRFYFERMRHTVLTYRDALGIWDADRWKPIVGCGVNLVLNIVLVKAIGVAGVALSTIVSFVIVEMPWETRTLFRKYFKRSEKTYYAEMIISTIKMLIAGFITVRICAYVNLIGISAIMVKMFICILVPNLIFWVLSIHSDSYIEAKVLIRNIFITILNWR